MRSEISADRLGAAFEKSAMRFDAILPDPGVTSSVDLQRREMRIDLADTLAALQDDYRELIVMRHLECLPFEKIGQRIISSAASRRLAVLNATPVLSRWNDPGELGHGDVAPALTRRSLKAACMWDTRACEIY